MAIFVEFNCVLGLSVFVHELRVALIHFGERDVFVDGHTYKLVSFVMIFENGLQILIRNHKHFGNFLRILQIMRLQRLMAIHHSLLAPYPQLLLINLLLALSAINHHIILAIARPAHPFLDTLPSIERVLLLLDLDVLVLFLNVLMQASVALFKVLTRVFVDFVLVGHEDLHDLADEFGALLHALDFGEVGVPEVGAHKVQSWSPSHLIDDGLDHTVLFQDVSDVLVALKVGQD